MILSDFLAEFYEQMQVKNIAKFEGKTIFLTGANGLVGSNILSYLHYLSENGLKFKLIAHSKSSPNFWLPKAKNITYLSGDLKDLRLDFHFDFLIHAATYAQPKKVLSQAFETIDLNVNSYLNLLERAKIYKASVLFFSTSSIYGKIPANENPAKESFFGLVDTQNQANLYGEAKRMAEIISQIYIKNGLYLKIIRLAIGYGPGAKLNDMRFINEFTRKALMNGEIVMMDEGTCVRQIGFITDVVEMSLNVLLNAKDSVYNVSGKFDNENSTILKIGQIIANLANVKLKAPARSKGVDGAQNSVVIDISKYCEEFKKVDFVPLNLGLNKVIEWHKFLLKEQK